jgi:hypothetical protein
MAVVPGVLSTQSKPFDYGIVAIDAFPFQIIEKLPALADQLQEPSARMVILFMTFEMLGQISNSFTEKSDLHLGRARVGWVHSETINNLLLLLRCHYHGCFLLDLDNSNADTTTGT